MRHQVIWADVFQPVQPGLSLSLHLLPLLVTSEPLYETPLGLHLLFNLPPDFKKNFGVSGHHSSCLDPVESNNRFSAMFPLAAFVLDFYQLSTSST